MTTDVWGVLTPTETGVKVRFERRYATTQADLWSSVTDPDRLLLTWSFPGEGESRLTVEIRTDGDGSVLVLEHLDLDESAARGYGGGWHASLDQLDDHVSGRTVRLWDDLFAAAMPRYR